MGLLGKKGPPEWVDVAGADDFAVSLAVKAKGQELALFRTDEGLFCTQASCSHEYSPLCDGVVEGHEVYCSKHGSRFDLRDGAALDLPATEPLRRYPVKVEAGRVLVQI